MGNLQCTCLEGILGAQRSDGDACLTSNELFRGAIVEFKHMYEDGILSPWKQGVVKAVSPDIVVDVICCSGRKETVTALEPFMRPAKMLVRNIRDIDEFEHLKGKAHGQQFCSTSVVSADHLVTIGKSQQLTLVMSIGLETNVVGGSTCNVRSGFQGSKNAIQECEIETYLARLKPQYMIDDYADRFKYSSAPKVSSDQLELLTWLFEDWRAQQKSKHNEVLVNLHSDMVFGILAMTDSADMNRICEAFLTLFGRQLQVISPHGRLFVVQS